MTSSITYPLHELAQLVADGNEQAFAQFHHYYYGMLHPYIRRHLPTAEDAEEVIQLVFFRAWLSRDKLPGIINMRAWLFKIATREYLTHIRNQITNRLAVTALDPVMGEGSADMDASDSPAHQLTLREIQALIHEAVQGLPPQRKAVFRLSRNEHFSIHQIAQQLGISDNTARNTLVAALATVREHLAAAGYNLPLILILGAQWPGM